MAQARQVAMAACFAPQVSAQATARDRRAAQS
jgi:hypothetical protein